MNVKPLIKYFPEIHHLPPEEQLNLVSKAHQFCFGPENKLRIWRSNLASGALLTGLSLLLIAVIGPLLQLSSSATAGVMILIILPGFFFLQHKRYICALRPKVQQLLAEQSANERA
jgi:hypothetical protein